MPRRGRSGVDAGRIGEQPFGGGVASVAGPLSGWLRGSGEDELRRTFVEWIRRVLPLGRFVGVTLPGVRDREGGGTMLPERAKEWTEQWLREGREHGLERGLERGRAEERALLCRQAARKLDAETATRLSGSLDRLTDPERLAEVGDWTIECGIGADPIDRAQRLSHPS